MNRAASPLSILFLASCAYGANLKPEMTEAWDAYFARLAPGAHFLWIDEEPERREHVRRQGSAHLTDKTAHPPACTFRSPIV